MDKISLQNPPCFSEASHKFARSILLAWGAVWIMILIGGATRLTGSGLSIAEWAPVRGILPPMTMLQWDALFSLYKMTPEFHHINAHFTLQDFKSIFWLEYIHRLWGRVLGLILLYPTWRAWRNPVLWRAYRTPLLVIWVMGIGQGLLGWYMVKSGLVHDPHVSPLRLSAHLLMAGAILSSLTWILLCARYGKVTFWAVLGRGKLFLVPLFLTIFYGALVAGTKAGLIYNEFPLMGGAWIPYDAFTGPLFRDLVSNQASVQWIHRVLATITLLSILYTGTRLTKSATGSDQTEHGQKSPPIWGGFLLGLVFLGVIQYMLGIWTLLGQVPLIQGVAHQGMAFLLLSYCISAAYMGCLRDTKSPTFR